MSQDLKYTFSLQDEISAKIANITVTSEKMLDTFGGLEQKTSQVTRVFNETGRTLSALRSRVDLLRQEREWIPAENLDGIRHYNHEIKNLNKEIHKLENVNGGKITKWSNQLIAQVPMLRMALNPLAAIGATIGATTKSAMQLDESMGVVNITARLNDDGKKELLSDLTDIAKENKVKIDVMPIGFEKINSQLDDVDASLDVLRASVRGSKAVFADLDVVSSALAQTLSIVGKESAAPQEILDTFIAAKRVGAGEFEDFAQYMPGLIAMADNLGMNFKEVAGSFSYMTGKGQSAERTAVLLKNLYSTLGQSNVREQLSLAGVEIFEDGKIRNTVDIFRDLGSVLGSLADEERSNILEMLGITDMQSSAAFSIMTSDLEKLESVMGQVGNATDETSRALEYGGSSMRKLQELWAMTYNIGLTLGQVMLPILNTGLDILTGALSSIWFVLEPVFNLFTWTFEQFALGTPLGYGLVAALGALGTVMAANYAIKKKSLIVDKAMALWSGILTVKNTLLTGSVWALTTALLANPLFWIPAVIGAVVAGITLLWQKFEGFRVVVYGVWEVIKNLGKALWDGIVGSFSKILSGFGAIGKAIAKLVKGDFSGAWESAKEGATSLTKGFAGMTPVGLVVNTTKNSDVSGAWEKGKQKGADSWAKSQEKKDKLDNTDAISSFAPVESNTNFDELQKKLQGDNDKKQKTTSVATKGTIDLNEVLTSQAATGSYGAIAASMQPKEVSLLPGDKSEVLESKKDERAFASNIFGKEEDEPKVIEKIDWLKDIGENVRKIAAILAVPIALSTANASAQDVSTISEEPTAVRSVQIDKFCDQIVIHVKEGSKEGVEEFAYALERKIKEVIEESFNIV